MADTLNEEEVQQLQEEERGNAESWSLSAGSSTFYELFLRFQGELGKCF